MLSISRNLRTDILKESTEHLVKYLGLDRLLVIDNKDALVKKSIELFDDYIKSINAEILESELINLDSIINDYFQKIKKERSLKRRTPLQLYYFYRVIYGFFAVKRLAQSNRSFAREKRLVIDEFFLFSEMHHKATSQRQSAYSLALPYHLIYYIKNN